MIATLNKLVRYALLGLCAVPVGISLAGAINAGTRAAFVGQGIAGFCAGVHTAHGGPCSPPATIIWLGSADEAAAWVWRITAIVAAALFALAVRRVVTGNGR